MLDRNYAIRQRISSRRKSICEKCSHRRVCRAIDNQPCFECNQFLNEDKQPKTNADRIRAMSDEELADAWMKDVVVCHRCAYVEECECDEYVTIEKCKEGLLEWLKQPAEGEENE